MNALERLASWDRTYDLGPAHVAVVFTLSEALAEADEAGGPDAAYKALCRALAAAEHLRSAPRRPAAGPVLL